MLHSWWSTAAFLGLIVPFVVQQHADIICVSYEARKLGVKKHMLPSDVRKRWAGAVRLVHCETLPTGKVTYRRYRAASRQLFSAIRGFLPEMHIPMQTMSFDECFLDVTEVLRERLRSAATPPPAPPQGSLSLSDTSDTSLQDVRRAPSAASAALTIPWSAAHPPLLRLARELRAWVGATAGLPVSVGGGASKLLAKLASKAAKPGGCKVLHRTQALAELWPGLSLRDLPSCGGLVGDLAEGAGVHTAEQLRSALQGADSALASSIAQRCGDSVLATVRALSECSDSSPVRTSGPPASVQSQCSFAATPLTSAPVPIPLWDVPQIQVHLRVLACDVLARCVVHFKEHRELPSKLNLSLVASSSTGPAQRSTASAAAPQPGGAGVGGRGWRIQRSAQQPDPPCTDTATSRVLPVPPTVVRWIAQQGGEGGAHDWLHALDGGDTDDAPPHVQQAAQAMLAAVTDVYTQLVPVAAKRLGWDMRLEPDAGMGEGGGAAAASPPPPHSGSAAVVLTKLNLAASAFGAVRNTLLGVATASPNRAEKRPRAAAAEASPAAQRSKAARVESPPAQGFEQATLHNQQEGDSTFDSSSILECMSPQATAAAPAHSPASPAAHSTPGGQAAGHDAQSSSAAAPLAQVGFPLSWAQFAAAVHAGEGARLLASVGALPP